MRIAIFAETFLPKWDGIATTLCYLLEHLAARGHASLMFAPQGAPSRYAQTRIVGLPGLPFPLYPELKLVPPGNKFHTVNVEEELTAFGPHLVHLVNPVLLGLAGLRHARSLGLPVVASYHTDIPGYSTQYGLGLLRNPLWAYFRWLHNQADMNLCPSRFTQTELVAHGFQRVKVWARGVDPVRFNPCHRSDVWRERLSGGHPEAPLLLYVGRLAPEKRVEWLHFILDTLHEARLAIVGDGPSRAALEERFADTPTFFAGYLRGEALSCAYASADVFCFPSATETFGNVVTEAMASGLPVVAPHSGGPVDHVINGHNGFLFAPDNPADLVAKVWRLASNLTYARELGANARAYAETQSWPAVLDGLLEDYALLGF